MNREKHLPTANVPEMEQKLGKLTGQRTAFGLLTENVAELLAFGIGTCYWLDCNDLSTHRIISGGLVGLEAVNQSWLVG